MHINASFFLCIKKISNRLSRLNLLNSASAPTTIFLIISFLLLTMAELLSVSLLKKAGGWELLAGERDPILRQK